MVVDIGNLRAYDYVQILSRVKNLKAAARDVEYKIEWSDRYGSWLVGPGDIPSLVKQLDKDQAAAVESRVHQIDTISEVSHFLWGISVAKG